ncbi:MAG: winged helix-turn-helix transcriptional regulator [Sphingobium sp.]
MTVIRSGCPINLTVELLGDRWTLVIVRDIMFGNRRHFRELLSRSDEGIASNILSDRLKKLVDNGLLTRADDPTHRQKAVYSLTEKAIELVPMLVALGAWGRRHLPVTPPLAIRQQLLEEGGPALWAAFMDELRHLHLGTPLRKGHEPVLERLTAEFQRVTAEQGQACEPAPCDGGAGGS